MSEAAVQDEYNALFKSGPRVLNHPADASTPEASDDESSTRTSQKLPSGISKSIRTSRRNGKASDADSDDDDDNELMENTRPEAGRNRNSTYYLPKKYNADSNTGPKGVIADAHAFEKEKARNTAKGPRFGRTRDLALPKSQRSRPQSEDSGRGIRLKDEKTYERSSEEDDEDVGVDATSDDEFVQSWREKRMKEMQSGRVIEREINGSPRRKSYGSLEVVDAIGFLDAIELVRSGEVVLVFIYDEEHPHEPTYTSALQALARQHSRTRIVALDYAEAEMERAGVPALLAYRDGDKVADIVPLSAECPVHDVRDDANGDVNEENQENEIVAKLEGWLKRLNG